MAILTQKTEYNATKMNTLSYLEFTGTFKICLIVLIIPLLVYYTLLLTASMVMAYFVHPIDSNKVICFSLLVCWTISGLSTSLASFILIIKFKRSTIIFSLASLSATMLFEYSLTLYEIRQPRAYFFTHIMIIIQLGLIAILAAVAHRMRMSAKNNLQFNDYQDIKGVYSL